MTTFSLSSHALKKPNDLISSLENTSRSSSRFSENMHLLQKELYKSKDWNYFFAISEYLSVHGINVNVKSYEQRVALEMLALSKHCRFKDALNLAQQIKVSDMALPIIDEAISVIELQKAYELKKNKGSEFTKTPLIVDSKSYWSIKDKQLLKLGHPKKIRKVVKSLCKI
jgi:hypothetical protein